MKCAPVLSAVIVTCVAWAAGAAEAASDPRALQLTYQPWAKTCVNRPDGNSDCFISSGAKGACQPSGGGIAVWIRDGKQRSLSINLVTRRVLDGHTRGPDRSGHPDADSRSELCGIGLPGQTRHRHRFH